MKNTCRFLAAVVVFGLTSAAMAEQIDNAEYTQWAKFKPGTTITLKQSMEMKQTAAMSNMPAGMDMAAMMPQTSVTTKLVEVKADSLTLETTTSTTQMGQTRDSKTTRMVPAKMDKPATTMPAGMEGMTADTKNMKEGKDVVEVNGKKIEAMTREYDTTVSSGGRGGMGGGMGGVAADSHVKVWTSGEVPGGMVKMESTSKTTQMGDVKTTMMLTDFMPGK